VVDLETLAQLIEAFGDKPGFLDELLEVLGADRASGQRSEEIRRLCQKWGYPEDEVFRALAPASLVLKHPTPDQTGLA